MRRPDDTAGEMLRRPISLANEVYEALYGQLMSLKIEPGSRISVDQLVRSLGVSQTPIREALSRLEAQGLVVKQHLLGFRAADQLDRARLNEIYEMRMMLEVFAAGRFAERRSKAELKELRSLDNEMKGIDAGQSRSAYGEFAKRDAAFHGFMAKRCGNELVFDTLNRFHIHVHLFRLHFHARATTDANKEHEQLMIAVENGNAAAAEEAMRHHLERSKSRFEGAFE